MLIGLLIQLYADGAQLFTDHSTNPVRMLPDSGRKDQIGKAAQIHEESADVVDDAGDKHIHGKLRPFISRIPRFHHIAQVIADTGDAQKSTFFLAALQNFFFAEANLFQKVDHGWIHIAHPVGVNQASFQGHSEAGVHAFTIQNAADGCTAA